MILKAYNKGLVKDTFKTYLTSAVAATGVTLTVRDNTTFVDDDYILLGEIGESGSEIVRIDAAIVAGTSITISACVYAHGVDTPAYHLRFNEIQFYRATTLTGVKAQLGADVAIDPTEDFTLYEDTANTTGFGFIRWYNSTSTEVSSWSGGVNYEHGSSYSSYDSRTLFRLRKRVRVLLGETSESSQVTDDQIRDELNDKQRDIAHRRLWSFYEDERSLSSVADQWAYDISGKVQKVHMVIFDTQPLIPLNYFQWKQLHWDTNTSVTDPSAFCVWNNQLLIYPRPSASANADAINDATDISATDTTIVADDTTGFSRGDYYRFIIDEEVIYSTNTSDDTDFTGCLRGREGTTAILHLDDAVITERDIVYTAHVEPTDLFLVSDRTSIPEAEVLALGAASKLALLIEKEPLSDRLTLLYKQGLMDLESKYSSKVSSQFSRVKASYEVMSDYSRIDNPNLYPKNINA